jgi:hypothetical protein
MSKPDHNAPRAPQSTASVWLQVRVRPEDKARWKELAAAEGVSMSRWIIETLNATAEPDEPIYQMTLDQYNAISLDLIRSAGPEAAKAFLANFKIID